MWSFLVIVFGIFVLIRVDKAFRKINEIEKRLNIGQGGVSNTQPQSQSQPQVSTPQPQVQPQAVANQFQVTAEVPEVKEDAAYTSSNEEKPMQKSPTMEKISGEEKKESRGMEHFLGAKFFAVLGVTSIVLAIGFFTLWAFANNIIGPVGRIFVGLVFSAAFLVAGELMKAKYPKFFQALSAIGIAGLLTTTFVARMHYEMISSLLSTIAYFVEVGLGMFLSLRYNSRVLGNFAVVGGLIAPFFINPEVPNAVSLLLILTVLSAAGFFIANKKKWPEILVVLFLGVLVFESMIMEEGSLASKPIIFIGFIFLLHTLIGSGGIIKLAIKAIKQKGENITVGAIEKLNIILFVSAILFANLFLEFIFDEQAWSHIGIMHFVQAGALFALFGFFSKFKIKSLRDTTLVLALVFTVIGTVSEVMEYSEDFFLSLILLAEGALFYTIGGKIKNSIFRHISRITILLAVTIGISSTSGFSEITIFTASSILALLYSMNTKESASLLDKLWNGLAIFIASVQVFFWSFDTLDDFIKSDSYGFIIFVAPFVWGTLMHIIGNNKMIRLFIYMGKFSILAAVIIGASLASGFSEITIFTLLSILTLLYSMNIKEEADHSDKLWSGLAIFIASVQVFFWSFDTLNDFVKSDSYRFLIFLAPVLWGIGMSLSVVKIKKTFLHAAGLASMVFINILFMSFAYGDLGSDISFLLSLTILLAGNFLSIYSLLLIDEYRGEKINDANVITTIILGLSSVAVLITGFEIFNDIERTIFWIIWGGALLLFGFIKHWKQFRYVGLAIFIFLIAKLYLVDVWEWEIWVRFTAFMAIGVALLVIAFFYQKKEK